MLRRIKKKKRPSSPVSGGEKFWEKVFYCVSEHRGVDARGNTILKIKTEGKGFMKKIFAVALSVFSAALFLNGCAKTPTYGKEYVFEKTVFEKDGGITIEDLAGYVPLFSSEEIDSVSDFENYMLENIDEYYINVITSSGTENVYFFNEVNKIRIEEDKIFLTTDDGEAEYGYTESDGKFVLEGAPESKYSVWGFEKGKFFYEIDFPVQFKFAVRHVFG